MSKYKKGLKVHVPACLSFLAFGLKDMSIALTAPGNEIKISHASNDELYISLYTKEKEDNKQYKDILYKIAKAFLDYVDAQEGLDLQFYNRIPFGMGLGNLEANIAGMIFAANDILKSHFTKKKILDFIRNFSVIFSLEINPSNIAANLYGGIILYNENISVPVQKLYSPSGINFTLIINDEEIFNPGIIFEDKESILKHNINIATLIKGLIVTDLDLIADSLRARTYPFEDFLPWYKDIKDISLDNGVYATGFNNRAESVFILNPNTLIRDNNTKAIKKYFSDNKLKLKTIDAEINLNGIFKF